MKNRFHCLDADCRYIQHLCSHYGILSDLEIGLLEANDLNAKMPGGYVQLSIGSQER